MSVQIAEADAGTAARPRRAARRGSPTAHQHVVQFYENDTFLTDAVADFLAEGVAAGEPLVVIATPPHREALSLRLRAHGIDVDHAAAAGGCAFLDARETLGRFMVGPTPDPQRFQSEVGGVLATLAERRPSRVRAYGEMVDVLWKEGNTDGAVRLEELWNELAELHDFSLLCAYAMGNFVGTAHAKGFQRVCRAHTHVVPTESYTRSDEAGRLLEIALLQQRARALESEVEHRRELEQRLRESLAARRRTEAALRERERQLEAALADREEALRRERSARTEAETARAAAEAANRAKSDFLAVMSHELRTPLNAVAGYSDLLELGVHGPLTHAQRDAVSRIRRSGVHLLGLINEVLNYARVESGNTRYEMADVPLDELLRTADALVHPQMLARGLRFAYAPCDSAVTVRADAEKVQQILVNLLGNATKFNEPGGSVRIACSVKPRKVLVQVTDDGIGIPPEKLDSIFDPFVQVDTRLTRAQEGVGLGLAISRDLARGMGGDLTAASTPGQGSTFTLTLVRGTARSARSPAGALVNSTEPVSPA
jgi:signal transduction histidine kinase